MADGQYAAKELTAEVAQKGLASIQQLREQIPEISASDFERRKERYASAPMPEQKKRTVKKFRCPWNMGDTYAYQISGAEAEQLGLAGKYMLFRKVDEMEFDKGHIMPIVTVSLWDSPAFPCTTQEFQSVPHLRIRNGGRCNSPSNKYEYRALIIIKSSKQLSSIPFQFVGNFQGVNLPKDEVIFECSWEYSLLLPEQLDSTCCLYWKMHQYCTITQSGN